MVEIRKFEIIWVDQAEDDLKELPLDLQATALRKLNHAVQRGFKGADRLQNWPGEYRRIRVDDHTRLVFFVDRAQYVIVVLSIDPRDKVYLQPNKKQLQAILNYAIQGIREVDPLFANDKRGPPPS